MLPPMINVFREGTRGFPKVDWPPNSPDFNPMERIWLLMKRIRRRRGSERITSRAEMVSHCRRSGTGSLWRESTRSTSSSCNHYAALPPYVNGGNKFHA